MDTAHHLDLLSKLLELTFCRFASQKRLALDFPTSVLPTYNVGFSLSGDINFC